MPKKTVKYSEGQWFAIPLQNGGYGLGIIVRGNYSTKGGLGYFFGPKCLEIPTGADTYSKNKDNPVLICHFGDLGIITGKWPFISEGKPFVREDWPVPLFHRVLPYPEGKVVVVEYSQDYSSVEPPIRETVTTITDEIKKLPRDILAGSEAVEIKLTKLLG